MDDKVMDLIEQRRMGGEIAKMLGLPFTSYPVLETIGGKVSEIRQDNGCMVIVLKNQAD